MTSSLRALALVLLLLASVVIGCKREDAPADPNVLTLYSGRSEALVAPLIERFEKETGLDVQVKYADSGELAGTIIEEGDRSRADVYWAQDAGTLGVLADRDLLARLPDDLLNKVDPRFRGVNGDWVGTSGRARVIAYNTERVPAAELPRSMAELTDAKWRGRIGWAPENASFQAFVAAMIELEGKDATRAWLEGMVANAPRAYPKNAPALAAAASGEVDLALVNHYYLYRARAEQGAGLPVANHYLRDGSAGALINVSGAAILSRARNRQAAERFVAYLLAAEAQGYFARETFEFPVIDSVAPHEDLPKLSELAAPKLDLTRLSHLEAALGLMRETGALP